METDVPFSIRNLDPSTDQIAVARLYRDAADFWMLTDKRFPDQAMIDEFFTATPPGVDAGRTQRPGYFDNGTLVGAGELSFGFPEPDDAYVGLMFFTPPCRGGGRGARFLSYMEEIARREGSPRILLGVLEANPRARAFWERHGFVPTGIIRLDAETGHVIHRLAKPLRQVTAEAS